MIERLPHSRAIRVAALAVVVPAAGLVAGRARRERILLTEQADLLPAATQRAQEEQARAAGLAERLRIAREVHDVLAHSLSGLSSQLEVARELLAERGDVEGALDRIERSRRIAAAGLSDARDAVAALRGEQSAPSVRLGHIVDDYSAETGASATFAVTGSPRPLPRDADLALQRVAQESLTNVRRHAAGAAVRVRLHFGSGETVLTVHDVAGDGRAPAAPQAGRGHGIAGMRERAELLGGRLDAGPAAGGWSVELRVPA